MPNNKLDKYGDDKIKEAVTDIYLFFPISDIIMEPMHNVGFKPNHVTFLSTLFTIIGVSFFYYDNIYLAVTFYSLGYIMDCLDGRMARNYNQGSTLGMILDTVSDNIANIPLIIMFLCKTISSFNYGICGKRKIFLFLLVLSVTYIFSAVFGINEAIESYEKTKDDNFYQYKIKLLKKEGYDKTVIGKLFLFIYKQSYGSYRYLVPEKLNTKSLPELKSKLLKLKEFGPGNYNVFMMMMMYLYSN